LVHPLDPIPRTAVLAEGFEETAQIRVFPQGWCCEAERFRPEVLAGPLNSLLALARDQLELTHGLIVFTYDFEARLSDRDRDLLWQAFGVPVFEQVLGPAEELLATECQAHDGLHVTAEPGALELDYKSCGCGATTPRLLESAAAAA
jgi:hypothetical protein